jgi:mevalonate pyrophosphate decarboxylase
MAVVPIAADIKTEDAHREVLTSPFFRARLTYLKGALPKMIRAVKRDDIPTIGHLTELDTLNLHAVTMTGRSATLLMRPESLKVIQQVLELRDRGVPAWYSLDTGPSVFVNTDKEHVHEIVRTIEDKTGLEVIQSQVGGAAHLVEDHLF